MLIIMNTILWVISQWIMFEKNALVQRLKIVTNLDNITKTYSFYPLVTAFVLMKL